MLRKMDKRGIGYSLQPVIYKRRIESVVQYAACLQCFQNVRVLIYICFSEIIICITEIAVAVFVAGYSVVYSVVYTEACTVVTGNT